MDIRMKPQDTAMAPSFRQNRSAILIGVNGYPARAPAVHAARRRRVCVFILKLSLISALIGHSQRVRARSKFRSR